MKTEEIPVGRDQTGFTVRIKVNTIHANARSFHLGLCPICEWTSSSGLSGKHVVRNVLRHIHRKHSLVRKAT